MKKIAIKLTVQNIISSRLQYIKYQQELIFKEEERQGNEQISPFPLQITDDKSAALAHDLILQFEQYGRTIRSLMLLWNQLNTSNAEKVYELLKEDQYLKYSNDELRLMLVKKHDKKMLSSKVLSRLP